MPVPWLSSWSALRQAPWWPGPLLTGSASFPHHLAMERIHQAEETMDIAAEREERHRCSRLEGCAAATSEG
ncbi:hypothetical protein EJB05_45763 [Eragrostis curvula]|uniref:Uncharacterized protein n=1 Tax=Eragrostis curvula TaxID=38414 RepID=A0A5J9TLG3_9POAL|nr:hypothetical protein EJB05_45763 [Eragrostis curvula]